MLLLDLSLPTSAENLALDETLLRCLDEGILSDEVLRFWESPEYFVVGGSGMDADADVNWDECARRGVPVMRRCSGGGTVMQGPGCLTYSLILSMAQTPEVSTISSTNHYLLSRVADAVAAVSDVTVAIRGVSDLACRLWKFSGNAQKRTRQAVLFHGTLLYDFPIGDMGALLLEPPVQPQWRERRSHESFVSNIPIDVASFKGAMREQFSVDGQLDWGTNGYPEAVRTRLSSLLKQPQYQYLSR